MNESSTRDAIEIFDIKDIAKLLHKSERTIKRYLKENPNELPPFFRCGRKTLWNAAVVKKWITNKNINSLDEIDSHILPPAIPTLGQMLRR